MCLPVAGAAELVRSTIPLDGPAPRAVGQHAASAGWSELLPTDEHVQRSGRWRASTSPMPQPTRRTSLLGRLWPSEPDDGPR
jgi:hypothetical protein